jgi:hypothetical protein
LAMNENPLRRRSSPTAERSALSRGAAAPSAVINTAKAAIVLTGPRGFGNTQQYERELALIRQAKDPAFPVVPASL